MLAAAAAGSGSLALVGAEAGAGKTSLVREFGARVSPRAVVLAGGCDPLTTPRPLSPLLDVASDPRAALLDVVADPALQPSHLFSELVKRMRRARPPVVLVVEDIHWADEGTLDFVRFVGRRVADLNAIVICTYRDDEVDAGHPARLVLGDLATRPTTHRLGIPPLSVAAVEIISGYSRADAERLHGVTGGNAFYVTEVVSAGEDVPGSVRDAVLARVRRLSPEARLVVETVATAPRDLELDYLLKASGAELAHVDEAASAGVLIAEGGHLRFRHELARGAVESSTALGRQVELHRKMIALVREDRPDDLARLAHHAGRAHAWDLVVQFAPEAARQASERGAQREAAEFYKLALARRELLEPPVEASLRQSLYRVYTTLDLHAEARAQSERAVMMRREIGDREDLSRALCQLAHARFRASDPDGALAAVGEALTLLSADRPSPALANAHFTHAAVTMFLRRREASLDAAEKALAMAQELGLDDLSPFIVINLAALELVTGRPRRGVELMREVLAPAAPRSLPARMEHGIRMQVKWMLGSGGGEGRVYAEAIEALDELIEHALGHDDDMSVAYGRAWLARIAFDQGRWAEAEALADLVPPQPGHGVIGPITALGAKGRIQVRRGDPEASATLSRALEVGERAAMQYLWSPLCGLAELAWFERREHEIPDLLRETAKLAFSTDSPWARGEVALWLWKAGELEAPPSGSAEPFAALIGGDWKTAAAAWEEIGCPYERAFALSHGDETAMLEALTVFDELQARPMASRLRAEMRARGVGAIPRGPRPDTLLNPAGLTSRQVEVLKLLVEGRSNAQIAASLNISPRTAEHHVAAVLSKLGAPTRARAIAKAARLGLLASGPDTES